MNVIQSHPVNELGYNFVAPEFLPGGANEYYLREQQNPGKKYRDLTTKEIDTLVHNRNTSDNWNMIKVDADFSADLVRNCKFFGLVRIGKLQPLYREFHNLRMPVGLYNSTIISCDFGDNVCIDNVNYLSHYILGNDVMIANVNELATTDFSKFGNGILKEGEEEKLRTWIEVCNENGGRKIIPFDGMLPGDAYMWSRYRDDEELLKKFIEFTERKFDSRRGYYGKIGDRSVIKNSRIIKDAMIGTDAYIKGANKLKNITLNSDAARHSQIGEGCELVNGVIGYGCRIFYGVKAVRFILSSHSQLKYGARLINSYLGNNSTISCCEVLNSLIFPSHEQHHNNSFLCASLIMGQSNIAAGATIGSNHNSRGADGEIIAERGFWPGLCVSLKHNSRFAAFTIIAKGDYSYELNIPVPFCLVSNDVSGNRLVVIPAYWFMYNMYALVRNSRKYVDRDKRVRKRQKIEYDFLAPDTVNEMFSAIELFSSLKTDEKGNAVVEGWENNTRPVVITKVKKAIDIFKRLIVYYAGKTIFTFIGNHAINSFGELKKKLPVGISRDEVINLGGQLVSTEKVSELKRNITSGKTAGWDEVHDFYREQSEGYDMEKVKHAYTSLLEQWNITTKQFDEKMFATLLEETLDTAKWIVDSIYSSREKDYSNPFRKMVYDNNREMNEVLGALEDNSFIQLQYQEYEEMKKRIASIRSTFGI